MIQFPTNYKKDTQFVNSFMLDAVKAIMDAKEKRYPYSASQFDEVMQGLTSIEAEIQKAVNAMAAIKANKDLKSEITLEKMGAIADAAMAEKRAGVEKLMALCAGFGVKFSRDALPKLPSSGSSSDIQNVLQSLKGDIRMVLDAANNETFKAEYVRLVEFYQERDNSLAVYLLCGSEFIELYAASRKMSFSWTLADQWEAYKKFATEAQVSAADSAAVMGDFRLFVGEENPFPGNLVIVPQAVVMADRGYDYALSIA